MELACYFANIEHLSGIEEALRPLDSDAIPEAMLNLIHHNVNLREYSTNLEALAQLEELGPKITQASRLYFGQEFCEHLIPDPEELETAYSFCRQLGWDLTYVTGCLTEPGLSRVIANLECLSRQDEDCEVVVNDWGLLSVIARDFARLQPVLGRLLVKQLRLAESVSWPAICMNEISASEQDIRAGQARALQRLNCSIAEYRQELRRLGVGRFELDIVPQSVDLGTDAWGFGVSCYYPWGYVTGGRNCSTAAITDARRKFNVLAEPCPRPCQQLNRAMPTPTLPGPTVQRGNTIFIFHPALAERYLTGQIPVDRIVFEPYIPI